MGWPAVLIAIAVAIVQFTRASCQSSKPPVILIYAKNIEPQATSVFFQSAQRYVPQAHIVLFTTPDSVASAK